MMREILFRGKRKDNGEWVQGYLYRSSEKLNPFIMLKSEKGASYEVNADTVGQYTSLTDKNGTKIFEGDILAFDDTDGGKGFYEAFWDGNSGNFAIAENGNRNYVDDFELFERNEWFKWFTVIGNIYDNPELLGDENNDKL